MKVLGIESTAHTFGIGVVEGKKILSSSRDAYKGKGIVPAEAAAHHRKVAAGVVKQALDKAGCSIDDIGLVAFSSGPGLPPCLVAGLEFARSLGLPSVAVNHCIAHIEVGKLDSHFRDPLTVYVSGGNTQIIAHEAGRYRVFGETLDIGLGNALDKFARELGLAMPYGPQLDALASRGKRYIELPYTVKGMDLTYSGLITAASKHISRAPKDDLCYSLQETAYAMLCEIAERALAHTAKKEVLLTGGVAQSSRLQAMIKTMASDRGAKFHVPERQYCGDNGAMIALVGSLIGRPDEKMDIRPRWRTDEVETTWLR